MPNYHYAPTRKGNREFWTRQVQAYHLSGLSQKEFCQKNDLIYSLLLATGNEDWKALRKQKG
ncbi:IS66 family insertion sequence element accessory protein TnpA [Ileibacterium valens]|uniref:Uncharacterized protein n=1 Tax=Ileibacterium valens TaxID=1862668 RepID=A0A1U7NDY6_9FIRM|nr:hypothetical protein [Ileibacterium valens]OLU37629.1 hypothetical protein BO222_10295 [Ileibacterium valens]OLU42218.1 hypothetical protein BO224_02305 [Erysipelotrichaceae bacterium NYU-BL-E8]